MKKNNLVFVNDELLELFSEQFSLDSFEQDIKDQVEESGNVINTINKIASPVKDNDDVKLIVNLSDEQKQAYKDGTLKLDVNKDGKTFAQIKENGKYGKKLSISEDMEAQNIAAADARFAAELNAIKDQLVKVAEALKDIEGYTIDTLRGLHNDRIGLFYSGLSTYVEASQMQDSALKDLLISQAIKSINDSQAQMMQELKTI